MNDIILISGHSNGIYDWFLDNVSESTGNKYLFPKCKDNWFYDAEKYLEVFGKLPTSYTEDLKHGGWHFHYHGHKPYFGIWRTENNVKVIKNRMDFYSQGKWIYRGNLEDLLLL